jgi:hypothetical protein
MLCILDDARPVGVSVGRLITAGLVDEYRLFAYSIVQSRGRRLFPESVQLPRLPLLEAKAFRGCVTYSCYAPA